MKTGETLLFHEYRPASWIRVSGEDAGVFLQGQFTNDVFLTSTKPAVYGLFLNQKGRVLADGFVLEAGGGAFWVASVLSPSGTIRERLEAYIVADDVALEDETAGWAGISLIGEGSGAWLAGQAPLEGRVFPGRRTRGENWEWIFPVSAIASCRSRVAGFQAVDALELERLRIDAGIPAVPVDAGPLDLPGEAGLGEEAISATKGCYLGQEIVARLKAKGTLRRRLHRVEGRGPVPGLPAGLLRDGRPAGELRSAASNREGTGFSGLAMMVLRDVGEARTLQVAGSEGVVEVG
jgi:folate-binding protein YgfZ